MKEKFYLDLKAFLENTLGLSETEKNIWKREKTVPGPTQEIIINGVHSTSQAPSQKLEFTVECFGEGDVDGEEFAEILIKLKINDQMLHESISCHWFTEEKLVEHFILKILGYDKR